MLGVEGFSKWTFLLLETVNSYFYQQMFVGQSKRRALCSLIVILFGLGRSKVYLGPAPFTDQNETFRWQRGFLFVSWICNSMDLLMIWRVWYNLDIEILAN